MVFGGNGWRDPNAESTSVTAAAESGIIQMGFPLKVCFNLQGVYDRSHGTIV